MNNDALHKALEKLEFEFQTGAPARVHLQESSPETTRERMERRVAREPLVRIAVDEACRQWIQKGNWSKCDAETSVYYWDRIVEARTFAQWLIERRASVEGNSSDTVLRWLLVDYWVLAGFYRWYARLWAAQRGEQ